jgi:succinyl-diaminopimelate desuccinylase
MVDVDLLKRLVAIPSEPDNMDAKREAVKLIESAAKERGLLAEYLEDSKGIPNVIVRHPNGKGKTVIFLVHHDVVPAGDGWDFDPYKPFIKDGKLFGRGAADNKADIVAALDAMAAVDDPVFICIFLLYLVVYRSTFSDQFFVPISFLFFGVSFFP